MRYCESQIDSRHPREPETRPCPFPLRVSYCPFVQSQWRSSETCLCYHRQYSGVQRCFSKPLNMANTFGALRCSVFLSSYLVAQTWPHRGLNGLQSRTVTGSSNLRKILLEDLDNKRNCPAFVDLCIIHQAMSHWPLFRKWLFRALQFTSQPQAMAIFIYFENYMWNDTDKANSRVNFQLLRPQSTATK